VCVCVCVCDLAETENKNPLIPGAELFRTISGIILMWLKFKFALNGLEIIVHSRLALNKFWQTGCPWTHCHTLANLNSFCDTGQQSRKSLNPLRDPGWTETHHETLPALELTPHFHLYKAYNNYCIIECFMKLNNLIQSSVFVLSYTWYY
jgi:hypothetical protein